jgi:hypothetical protein
VRDVELEWFGLKVQGAVLTKRGTAFQDFFSDIMEAAHPGDFERVRAYGKKGDLKCDGFLRSQGTVFQVYAPRQMKEAALLKKIATDFEGADALESRNARLDLCAQRLRRTSSRCCQGDRSSYPLHEARYSGARDWSASSRA